MKKAKAGDKVTQTLSVISWNSELQQYFVNGIRSWGNNFRLKGTPQTGSDVTNCIVDFSYQDNNQNPSYDAGSKTITLSYPYDSYASVLQFIQTSKSVAVYFESDDNGDVTAFLYNGAEDINEFKIPY